MSTLLYDLRSSPTIGSKYYTAIKKINIIPKFWMNLQMAYHINITLTLRGNKFNDIIKYQSVA